MATSEVSICNIAISWLAGNQITSLEDDTTEAILCSANYANSRDAVLEDGDWTFAMKRALPSLKAEPPLFGFSSAFLLPPDFIRPVELSQKSDFRDNIDEFEIESGEILCNYEVIYLRYIWKITDPSKFSAGFVQALAARLAADICVPLTHDTDLFANYWTLYESKRDTALANDGLLGPNRELGRGQIVRVR